MKPQNRFSLVTIFLIILCLLSCSHDSGSSGSDGVRKITVAVVLPITEGSEQNTRFRRMADWYLSTLKSAVSESRFSFPFTLNLEWYNEDSIDIAKTAETLANRSDVFAVIGPLSSDHVQTFAEQCFTTKKPLIAPCVSSEGVVRAFAVNAAVAGKTEPFLWTLTETDISQAEALLSKAKSYGGEKIALLSSADMYGKTFFDWTPFLANELKLELVQNVRYTSANTGTDYEAGTAAVPLDEAVSQAVTQYVDYVICALSSYKDAEAVLSKREELGDDAPKLFFTDSAFSADFLATYGDKAEGVEGTAPYADPTSGFAIEYYARFGQNPVLGEAHFYDALLLCSCAAAICLRNEKTNADSFSNTKVNEAIKNLNGEGSGGHSSWNLFGLSMTLRSLETADERNIDGATGLLDFDTETLTSAVRTVYAHWALVEGAFVVLDFTSSDGTEHTGSNHANWEWSVVFDDDEEAILDGSKSASVTYADRESRWAVIVAASKGWANYRHQADALFMYQILKKNGNYDDDHIILILADDIAHNQRNKKPGEIVARLNGDNLYTEDIQIDYLLSELTASDISQIMQGAVISVDRSDISSHPNLAPSPTVLETDEKADILWFWSGHGANRNGNAALGQLVWQGKTSDGFTTELMKETLSAMKEKSRLRKLLIVTETCYSASVLNVADGFDGVLAFTAANGSETSLADVYSVELKVWISNRFTHNFTDKILSAAEAFDLDELFYADLYKYLVQNTIGSHVQLINAANFGNLYKENLVEFFGKEYEYN